MNLKIHCQKVLMSYKPKCQYSNLLNRWASPAIMNCWVLVQFLFPNMVKKEKTQCDAALQPLYARIQEKIIVRWRIAIATAMPSQTVNFIDHN